MIKTILIIGCIAMTIYGIMAFRTFKLAYKTMNTPLNEIAKHADDLQQLKLYNANGEAYTVYIPK